MATDVAQLGFNIDSTPLSHSASAMSLMATNARLADQGVQGLSQSSMQANTSLTSLGGGIGIASSQLSMMAASLQTVITQLQTARSAIDGTAASFSSFLNARDRVEALSGALGTGVVALESYAQTAARLHMTSIEMVTSIQRVTQAIEAQTAAGRNLREIMQSYGVNVSGMQPEQSDQALQQFIERARAFRPSPGNYQNIQSVLGPMSVDALTSVMHPDYEPVMARANRLRAEDISRDTTTRMDDATRVIRETQRNAAQLADLGGSYDLARLNSRQQQQLMTSFRRYDDSAPGDASTPANRLRVLQYLATAAPDDLRSAAEVPYLQFGSNVGGGFVGPGFGPSRRQVSEFMGRNPIVSEAPNLMAQGLMQSMGLGSIVNMMAPDSYYNSDRYRALRQSARAQAARRAEESPYGDIAGLPTLWRGLMGALNNAPIDEVSLGDNRPEDPYSVLQRRVGDASVLAGYGYGAPLRSAQSAQQVMTLAGPPGLRFNAAEQNFVRMMGESGYSVYANMLDLTRRQEVNAVAPGGDALDQASMDAWVRAMPIGQRGRAEELIRFARQNQVSTMPWAERGLGVDAILSARADRSGTPGQMLPGQQEAFGRIQSADLAGFRSEQQEGVSLNARAQAGIREAMPEGQLAVEQMTAYWNTYVATLRTVKSEAKATEAALAAMTQAQERQKTASEAAVQQLSRQNTEQERTLALMRAAGSDPMVSGVAGAMLTGDIAAGADGIAPAERGAYIEQRYRQAGVSAAQATQRGVADTTAQLDQQRTMLSVAGQRADIQQRVATSMAVERQYQDEIAKATEAAKNGQGEWLENVLRQVQAIKEMRAAYDDIGRTIDNLNKARDTNLDAGFQDMLNRAPPQERERLRGQIPVLRDNPQLGGGGGYAMNNPLGLEYAGQPGATRVGRFASFETPEAGWGAMRNQFGLYAGRGINTIRGLVTRWAPPNENDTAKYIAHVAKQVGMDPDAPIDLRDQNIQNQIFSAMRQMENMQGARNMPPPDAPGMMSAARSSTDPGVSARMGAAENLYQAQRAGRVGDVVEAQGYSNAQREAEITMLRGGDFGRRLARAMVVDQRSDIGDTQAMSRVTDVLGGESLSLRARSTELSVQAENVRGLTAAWREGREAGEAYERHLANDNQIRALDEVIKKYPQLTKQIREFQEQLRAQNQSGDALAIDQRIGDVWKNINGNMENQNRLFSADIEAGPFASASRIGQMRGMANLRNQLGEKGWAAMSESDRNEALSKYGDNESLRQQAEDVRTVRQEFLRLETAAMSAFESAVVGGQKMSTVLLSLGQDMEKFLLRAFVERPLMKGFEYLADSALGGIGKMFSGGSSSSSSGGVDQVATGAVGALGKMLGFIGNGDVLDRGVPMRFAASGMMIDRPTVFAAGGAVMAGEIDKEAIFPLKRDASGNLGIRASGGGGPQIQIHAPIVVQGGGGDKNGKMDPAAMASMQKQFEAMFQKSVRNVLVNEQRDGGDLSVGR